MRPINSRLRSVRGFTILEVAGAATVLALTLTGMIGVVESGARILDLSRKQTMAAQILHSEVEELRMSSWSTVSALPSSTSSLAIDSNFNASQTGFSSSRQVSWIPGTSGTEAQVTFTVIWKGITGTSYSRSSTTHVANNGIYISYQRS